MTHEKEYFFDAWSASYNYWEIETNNRPSIKIFIEVDSALKVLVSAGIV